MRVSFCPLCPTLRVIYRTQCFFACPLPVLPRVLKPVRTPVAILGSLGVCIYVPASRHWLISYSPIHLI